MPSHRPPEKEIRRAARIIRAGGAGIFPTSGLYGLGGNALSAAAVDRVFCLKQRPFHLPLLVLVSHPGEILSLVTHIPETARSLMDAFWPGGLTIIFPAASHLPRPLTAGTGTIGIRQARHPWAAALCKAAGCPVIGTSANISGRPAVADPDELDKELIGKADFFLDAGKVSGGGSSIVDCTVSPPRLIRGGGVPGCALRPYLADGPCFRAEKPGLTRENHPDSDEK